MKRALDLYHLTYDCPMLCDIMFAGFKNIKLVLEASDNGMELE
jgi:hypothetical protein